MLRIVSSSLLSPGLSLLAVAGRGHHASRRSMKMQTAPRVAEIPRDASIVEPQLHVIVLDAAAGAELDAIADLVAQRGEGVRGGEAVGARLGLVAGGDIVAVLGLLEVGVEDHANSVH